jgi:hypothetical protein
VIAADVVRSVLLYSPPKALAADMRELERQFPDPALWGAFDLSAVGADAIFSLDQDTHSREAQ